MISFKFGSRAIPRSQFDPTHSAQPTRCDSQLGAADLTPNQLSVNFHANQRRTDHGLRTSLSALSRRYYEISLLVFQKLTQELSKMSKRGGGKEVHRESSEGDSSVLNVVKTE